ncbi:MAG: ABC transporter ATP-binding protein [Candidatus Thorarchaeota archaeon]
MYAVELENISKTFASGVQANKDITLKIKKGEVHGLLGENGAGKSTLMHILYGLLSMDSGSIKINEVHVDLYSPQDAINHGIGMVHQHFKLIPPLSVTENVILGAEPVKGEIKSKRLKALNFLKLLMPIDINKSARKILEIAKENGLEIDPYAKIFDLSVGLQQRVEIIKTLYREAEILILDEPTSVLTPQEVDELFLTLEQFKKAGRTIILITHKLRETMLLCDRISVLRDGSLVGTVDRDNTSPEELAKMMVGRPVVFELERIESTISSTVLTVQDLHVNDNRDLEKVRGINLEVRAGEILGIAGVDGNGQTELIEAIAGLRKPEHGRIAVYGQDITGKNARYVRGCGVSHIPEDRQKRGLILGFTVKENLALGQHHSLPFATGPSSSLLDLQTIQAQSDALVDQYSIKVSDSDALVSTLSGGNQQKIVVARELASSPKLILAAQPTRGLDVGATEYIRRILLEKKAKGVAILLVSAELDEIRNISDRIAVIYDGRIVAIRNPDETTQEELGLLMAGHIDTSMEV